MSATRKRSWTAAVRQRAVGALPPEKLLPDSQPSYMASWIYIFGVLSLTSLVLIIASGSILTLKGPGWWHFTGIGHFFNSIHLWSVELFFFFIVIHLWAKYWMAAWRGGRAGVWMTGAVTFVVAIPCALTGYVSQQNFDAQFISTQAKDAMNAAGSARSSISRTSARCTATTCCCYRWGSRARHRARPAGAKARDCAALPAVRHRTRACVDGRARVRNGARIHGLLGARVVSRESRRREDDAAREWKGAYRPYDIVREATIALGVVLAHHPRVRIGDLRRSGQFGGEVIWGGG